MLKISGYMQRVKLVDLEFQFLRYAVSQLSKSARAAFFRDSEGKDNKKIEAVFQKPQVGTILSQEERAELLSMARSQNRKKFAPRNRRIYYEAIEDGVNASELLVRVALFEAFMKDVHAEVLRAKPSILAKANPNRTVTYDQPFEGKSNLQQIIEQEVMREAEKLDRQKFQKRNVYFQTYLKIEMRPAESVKLVSEALDLRNELSHENPLKTFSSNFLLAAANALKGLPLDCCNQAQNLYPPHFK